MPPPPGFIYKSTTGEQGAQGEGVVRRTKPGMAAWYKAVTGKAGEGEPGLFQLFTQSLSNQLQNSAHLQSARNEAQAKQEHWGWIWEWQCWKQ